jgi:hypothetical protein
MWRNTRIRTVAAATVALPQGVTTQQEGMTRELRDGRGGVGYDDTQTQETSADSPAYRAAADE